MPWGWVSLGVGISQGACPLGLGVPWGWVSRGLGGPPDGHPSGPADGRSLQCSFLPKFSIYIETKYEDNCGDSENVSLRGSRDLANSLQG